MNEYQEKQPKSLSSTGYIPPAHVREIHDLGACQGPPSNEYIPFGPEWEKEMWKWSKRDLIAQVKKMSLLAKQYDPGRKTNAKSYAEQEIDILLKLYPTDENPPIIKDFIPEILALVDKFGRSGQSGGSAPFTASAIADSVKKLCLFKPICDITGDESEWGTRADSYSQNKRYCALFRDNTGRAYYLDAVIFKNQKGTTWSTEHCKMPDGSVIGSRQYVKSFPWKPKTFYIDVIETEVAKDDFEYEVKDVAQLDEVWAYYDRYYHNLKA